MTLGSWATNGSWASSSSQPRNTHEAEGRCAGDSCRRRSTTASARPASCSERLWRGSWAESPRAACPRALGASPAWPRQGDRLRAAQAPQAQASTRRRVARGSGTNLARAGTHPGTHGTSIYGIPGTPDSRNHAVFAWPRGPEWPREESNLRTRIRSPPLYPLSYGARAGFSVARWPSGLGGRLVGSTGQHSRAASPPG
jgi:hypothetical protein